SARRASSRAASVGQGKLVSSRTTLTSQPVSRNPAIMRRSYPYPPVRVSRSPGTTTHRGVGNRFAIATGFAQGVGNRFWAADVVYSAIYSNSRRLKIRHVSPPAQKSQFVLPIIDA